MPYYLNAYYKSRIYIELLQKAYCECHYFFQMFTPNCKNADPGKG